MIQFVYTKSNTHSKGGETMKKEKVVVKYKLEGFIDVEVPEDILDIEESVLNYVRRHIGKTVTRKELLDNLELNYHGTEGKDLDYLVDIEFISRNYPPKMLYKKK